MPNLIRHFDKILTWAAIVLGGSALAFMTIFSVWNVLIMRKAMNNPITGAEDLLLLCLVVIVALSVGLGSRTGAHIEIEILESKMSVWFAKWSLIDRCWNGFGRHRRFLRSHLPRIDPYRAFPRP